MKLINQTIENLETLYSGRKISTKIQIGRNANFNAKKLQKFRKVLLCRIYCNSNYNK